MATVSCRWVMNPKWLIESKDAGILLPEEGYGVKLPRSPLMGKRIFITPEYKEQKGFDTNLYTALISQAYKSNITVS